MPTPRTVLNALLLAAALAVLTLPSTAPIARGDDGAPDTDAPGTDADTPSAVPMPTDLPDFSWAGYAAGERAIPERDATLDVTEFGAIADDDLADHEAIQAAIDKATSIDGGAVIAIPEGRFILEDVVTIRADDVVLRGAGSGKTILHCPKSLSDIHGYKKGWSWSGGFIDIKPGGGASTTLGRVHEPTDAGATTIVLTLRDDLPDSDRPRAGEWLDIRWHNDKGTDTLLDWLYGGVIKSGHMGTELQESDAARIREWVRVDAVAFEQVVAPMDPTTTATYATLTLAQPLRVPCRPEWNVGVTRRPFITGVGVDGITIDFPLTDYPGHLKERGHNGMTIGSAIDCWIRDIETVNADSGVFIGSSKHVTLDGANLHGRTMHHPICMSWSADCLATNWRIDAPQIHGTTISWCAHGNVFSNGYGTALAMDSHRAASFMNLHTAITIKHGPRVLNPFRSGGSKPRGPHAARQNVYWNIEHEFHQAGDKPHRFGPVTEWPLGVFVGWYGNRPVEFAELRGLKQQLLAIGSPHPIANLHEHQLAQRLGE